MEWTYVVPEAVPLAWKEVASSIRRGLQRGCGDTLTEEGLLSDLIEGKLQLWLGCKDDGSVLGCIILMQSIRERGTALVVVMTAGRWWQDGLAMDAIKAYADQIGAYTIEAVVRTGIVDRLRSHGWRHKAVIMDLER